MLTNTDFTGKFLVHLRAVDSTNDHAKAYLSKTTPKDGSVILADEQYAGRGQAGADWMAEPGKNLTFSIIYFTDFLPAAAQFGLSMAVALGLSEAVAACLNAEIAAAVRIKWPNDIYVKDEKLAGILIENVIQGERLSKSIIGIGLNVNQLSFPDGLHAASLARLCGHELDKLAVLRRVLEQVEKRYLQLKREGAEAIRADYLARLYRFGEWYTYSDAQGKFTGRITGVNVYGHLLVETETGTREFGMKEIAYL